MSFKRSNRASNGGQMQTVLVGSGDQALASGALVNATTSLGIASGQLGVLSWDFDGTVALGNFITAGVTATNVNAIKILQGTAYSSQTHLVKPWEVTHPAYVESGVIRAENIRSVMGMTCKVPSYSAHAFTDITAPTNSTEYGMYVYLTSVRNDRDFSDNDEVLSEVFQTPNYTALSTVSPTDHLIKLAMTKLNFRSKLASLSNAGIRTGTRDVVGVAINTGGGNGTPLGTITCGTTIPFFKYDGVTSNIVANEQLIIAIAKIIKDQADQVAAGTTITNQITGSSTIELIDMTTAGEGELARGTLTTTGNFTANDEVTIGAITYKFVASPSAAYDVDLGATAAISLSNLEKAVNATGTAGTEYAAGTLINAQASAVATATTLVITSKLPDTSGNAVVLTEDTDGGGTWSVSGSGTLAGGATANCNAFIVFGLDEVKGAYFDDIEQVTKQVQVNLSLGFRSGVFTESKANGEEGTGQGWKWTINYNDRAGLNVHTKQVVPFGEFFSRGYTYINPDLSYTSYIIDYYETEDTLTVSVPHEAQVAILLPCTATCTTVATAVTNLASGPAIPGVTDDTTTTASLEAILGAWLDSAKAKSGHSVGGESAVGANFV